MTISPKLDLKQGQQLVMTPQLQQAIKLLQLTNLELAEFVEDQLLENPFLERDERQDGQSTDDGSRAEERSDAEVTADPESLDTDFHNIEREALPGDAGAGDWSSVSGRAGPVSEEFDASQNAAQEVTLHEHLVRQLHIATRDERQLLVGAHLIDLIDDGGYMRDDVTVIAHRLGADETYVLKTLELIQTFEPAGVGARTLVECLAIQLKERGAFDECTALFLDNIHYLGTHNMPALRRACRLSDDALSEKIALIRSLDPKPGHAFGGEAVPIVIPDVQVTEADDGGWKVELNAETLPRVIANERYFARLSASGQGSETRNFLNEHMSQANWLVKSLDQRARTILKVSTEIVKYQDEFLVKGISFLRPLNLRTIADTIEMHESTVSRVTSNKYMSTPRGTFEMKYFFTPAIPARNGESSFSAETVRHRIGQLIADEDSGNPISDDRLVALLAAENIDIARRTVAKYREALGIPSSIQRRRAAKQSFR